MCTQHAFILEIPANLATSPLNSLARHTHRRINRWNNCHVTTQRDIRRSRPWTKAGTRGHRHRFTARRKRQQAEIKKGLLPTIHGFIENRRLDKVEHSPVLQAIEAVAAGDDLVADVALQRGVLMEDGLPIGLDGADAARDDFVEDGDDGLLGYVLRRC